MRRFLARRILLKLRTDNARFRNVFNFFLNILRSVRFKAPTTDADLCERGGRKSLRQKPGGKRPLREIQLRRNELGDRPGQPYRQRFEIIVQRVALRNRFRAKHR